jgi:hypothetical protein
MKLPFPTFLRRFVVSLLFKYMFKYQEMLQYAADLLKQRLNQSGTEMIGDYQ